MVAAVMAALVVGCAGIVARLPATPAPGHAIAPPWNGVPHGRTSLMRIRSLALDQIRTARIYLPPSYDRPESSTKRYPVVYLLHGGPGGDGNWLGHGRAAVTLDTLIARQRIPELIAVMPNGNGVGLLGRSLYLNSYDDKYRMADWIVHDVVGWADSALRTRREPRYRAIIGLSDGGTAALNLCFKHPDVFGACGGESGQYRMKHDVGLRRIVPRLRRLVIYFDCGQGDPEVRFARELDALLQRLGVPHTYREFPGRHGWGYWKKHLDDALIAVTAKMR